MDPGRDDLDGRPDADDLAQRDDVAVSKPDATMRDGLSDEPRRVGAVDADDATARPIRELRVAARLERVGAEDRVAARHEARLDEEEPGRRLHPARPDRDRPGPPELAVHVELELARARDRRRATGRRARRRRQPRGSSRCGRWAGPARRSCTTTAPGIEARRARAPFADGSPAGTGSASSRPEPTGSARHALRPAPDERPGADDVDRRQRRERASGLCRGSRREDGGDRQGARERRRDPHERPTRSWRARATNERLVPPEATGRLPRRPDASAECRRCPRGEPRSTGEVPSRTSATHPCTGLPERDDLSACSCTSSPHR